MREQAKRHPVSYLIATRMEVTKSYYRHRLLQQELPSWLFAPLRIKNIPGKCHTICCWHPDAGTRTI